MGNVTFSQVIDDQNFSQWLTQQWWTLPQWSRLALHTPAWNHLSAERQTQRQKVQYAGTYIIHILTALLNGFDALSADRLDRVFVACVDGQLQCGQLLILPPLWLLHFGRLCTNTTQTKYKHEQKQNTNQTFITRTDKWIKHQRINTQVMLPSTGGFQ